MKHLRYLSYILRHKWYVLIECCRLGIPWRGLVHDLSKFRPSEWFPYVEKFFGAWREMGEKLPEHELIFQAFDKAWLLHQHRNPHHWEFWILRESAGQAIALDMPEVYTREMVADWRGAGMAIHGRDEVLDWYTKTKATRLLSPKTLARVEELIGFNR